MSEFDDNPFADPFADPSIRQATQSNVNANSSLADYDPFSAAPTNPAGGVVPSHQPATVQPTYVPPSNVPPPYTPTPQQQVSASDFQRRQEELERKAQELARREEELRNASVGGARQDNWPPLPSGCPVGPCFYQDINVDIPLEFQRIVRMLYYSWMFNVLMLMVNVLGGLAEFVSFGEGQAFGLALLFLVLFSPLSYLCWFRPIYKAFRNDSSFNFMVFFIVFFFQLLICVGQAIGIGSLGATGWVGVGKAFQFGYIGTGIFLILVALANSALAGFFAAALIWVHRIYRSTGASFSKAQAEFAQGVMKNEHVQNVASNAASAAVRNQFSAQSPTGSTGTNASGPRF